MRGKKGVGMTSSSGNRGILNWGSGSRHVRKSASCAVDLHSTVSSS